VSQRLRDNLDELDVLVDQTANELGLPAQFVEKDFWATEVLRAATINRSVLLKDGTRAPVTFLFKGGTSLSRVFKLVERFSEDIDLLAVFPEEASIKAKDKVLKEIVTATAEHLRLSQTDVTPGSSTTGVKRNTTFHYPTSRESDGTKEGVLLELGTRGGLYPASTHKYRSMLADFAINTLNEDVNSWAEFADFDVPVLAPERTLLEKIAAVHDSAERKNTEKLSKHGRHFYDIARLLADSDVIASLDTLGLTGVVELVDDINKHSDEAGFTWSSRPPGGFADSPAFDPNSEIFPVIQTGYESSKDLIFGTPVPLNEVIAIVNANRERL